MLNNLSIKFRMFFYIILTTIIFFVVGYLSQLTLKEDSIALQKTSADLRIITASANVNYITHQQYTQLLLDIKMGITSWEGAASRIRKAIQNVQKTFSTFNNSLPESVNQSKKGQELFAAQDYMIRSFVSLFGFFRQNKDQKSQDALNSFIENSMLKAADSVVVKMNAITEEKYAEIQQVDAENIINAKAVAKQILIALTVGGLIAIIFGILLMYSVVKPTNNLTQVVRRLSEGEYSSRASVKGTDEIAQLGIAFNDLLNDRAMTLTNIDEEHKQLNDSVFRLLDGVAQLAEKDLTVRTVVTEDATGPVADSLNLLAQEMTDTLKEVKHIASKVNEASNKVNIHLSSINELSQKEQSRAISTVEQMNIMIDKTKSISNFAANTNKMAGTTTDSTKKAYESVKDTLTGMSDIRSMAQETGKSMKQLGERSQEITRVIDIIDGIAERTTVLALNASMQAAAAGNEGLGFTVIAEEIKRLADNSQDSTSHISTLIRNIQQETNTTIETMDKTITQVIKGSIKAADATDQMNIVLSTTSELVNAVEEIATTSIDQVNISNDLKYKSESILKSTQETGNELTSLTDLSQSMSNYARQLVSSVNIFKLDNREISKSSAYNNKQAIEKRA